MINLVTLTREATEKYKNITNELAQNVLLRKLSKFTACKVKWKLKIFQAGSFPGLPIPWLPPY